MIVRTKIKQKPEDVLEFEDKPKSIYPKILELPEREPKKHNERASYSPETKQVTEESI